MTWLILIAAVLVVSLLALDAYLITRAPRSRPWHRTEPELTPDEELDLLLGDWPYRGDV